MDAPSDPLPWPLPLHVLPLEARGIVQGEGRVFFRGRGELRSPLPLSFPPPLRHDSSYSPTLSAERPTGLLREGTGGEAGAGFLSKLPGKNGCP